MFAYITNASIQKQYCANAVETAKATIFSQRRSCRTYS